MSNHEIVAADPAKAKRLLVSYLWGFVLAVAFSLLAYWLVQSRALDTHNLYLALGGLVVLQVLVQIVFFFRLNTATEDDRWNLIIVLFTLLIMLIVVSGSLWIMYNLNYYMVN